MLKAVHRHVQKDISAALHKTKKVAVRAAMPVEMRRNFDSGDTKFACAWLTALPSSPQTQMGDREFGPAFVLRLMFPLECIMALPDQCPLCHNDVPDFTEHTFRCVVNKGARTFRHDHIKHTFVRVLREWGESVLVEPVMDEHFARKPVGTGGVIGPVVEGGGAAGAAPLANTTGEGAAPAAPAAVGAVGDAVGAAPLTTPAAVGTSGGGAKQGKKKKKRIKPVSGLGSEKGLHSELDRADVAIRQNGNIKSFFDISVCATNLKSDDPGAAARKVEKTKALKYSRWDSPDATYHTLAFERNGTWGAEAVNFIESMGSRVGKSEQERATIVWRLVARLSMALQRGNAHYVDIMTRAWSRALGVSQVVPGAVS
jgi:hypothetical protein